jgi:hypothetical protein
MATAKVTQCSHRNNAPDDQRATSTSIAVVTARNIIEIDELGEVRIRCSVVGDAKRDGKVDYRVAEFLTQRLGRTCNCDTDAAIMCKSAD